MPDAGKLTLWAITLLTTVVHTVAYFFVGLLAFTLFNYSARFADPALSSFMRQTNDPLVAAGVLFQPLRGLLFGIVFYLLRDILFSTKNGWLVAWVTLVIVGIFWVLSILFIVALLLPLLGLLARQAVAL